MTTKTQNKKASKIAFFYGINIQVFKKIKQDAKRRNIPFDITIEELWEIFEKQNRKCALTGKQLTHKDSRYDTSHNASLDRIDSKKGYYYENVQWVDKEINMLKGNLDEEKFIRLCKEVATYSLESLP